MTRKVFIFLAFSILFLSFYFSYTIIKYPFIGIEVEQNSNGQYEVIKINSNGSARDIRVKKGDIILSINGVIPNEYKSVKKHNLVEQAESVVIQREGKRYNYDLPRLNQGQLIFHIVFPSLLLSLAFLFSILLFRNKKNEKATLILIMLLQFHGISAFSGAASARTDPIAQFVSISVLLLMPVLLIHFFIRYFEKFNILFFSYKMLKIVYIANFLLIIIASVFLNLPQSNALYLMTKSLILFMFTINVVSCIVSFGRGFLKFRKSIYSSLFKIINVGIILSFFPFIFLYALPTIFFNQELVSGEVAFIFTYFLPLTFVYLVSANQLLDINFYIKRLYYYSIFSIIPAVVFTFITVILTNETLFYKWVQIFIIIYTLFVIVFYLKEELDYRFRSKLFSERNNLQSSIYQFVHFLSYERSKRIIEQQFVTEIKSVLALKNAALLEFDKEKQIVVFKIGDQWDYDYHKLKSQFSQYYRKSFIGELEAIESNLYLVVGENSKKILLLVLGKKRNLTALNLDEREWLKSISYFMNVSYQNLQMIEDLIDELEHIRKLDHAPSWLLRMLFNLEEKERKRLSIDLHDAALQDQLLLYRKLNDILEKYSFDPVVKNELTMINEGLLDVIHEIRETCNELMPPFLKEIGIIGSLENLIKKVQLRTNLVIDFMANKEFSIPLQDETSITIYRVFQELLNNAEKHSNASNVEITLSGNANSIILTYKDNGYGIDEEALKTFKGRIGIYGIKERIRSVGGQFDLISASHGLEIAIEIPLVQADANLVKEEVLS